MTHVTAEDIVRGVVEECGWELLSFRREARWIFLTVCDPAYGVPVECATGAAKFQQRLELGDNTLDAIRDMLTGAMGDTP